jgi:hypothetical protein
MIHDNQEAEIRAIVAEIPSVSIALDTITLLLTNRGMPPDNVEGVLELLTLTLVRAFAEGTSWQCEDDHRGELQ